MNKFDITVFSWILTPNASCLQHRALYCPVSHHYFIFFSYTQCCRSATNARAQHLQVTTQPKYETLLKLDSFNTLGVMFSYWSIAYQLLTSKKGKCACGRVVQTASVPNYEFSFIAVMKNLAMLLNSLAMFLAHSYHIVKLTIIFYFSSFLYIQSNILNFIWGRRTVHTFFLFPFSNFLLCCSK